MLWGGCGGVRASSAAKCVRMSRYGLLAAVPVRSHCADTVGSPHVCLLRVAATS